MRRHFRVVRLLVLGVGSASLALGLLAAVVWLISDSRLNQRISVAPETIGVPTDITAIQRGAHLAGAVAICQSCHGATLGGGVVVDNAELRIVAPNLTHGRGGVGASFATSDFVRAIRYGLDPSGRLLLSMPADAYFSFSDADLGDLIAFLEVLPPADSSLPDGELHPLGRLLFVTGQLRLLPAAGLDHTPPPPTSADPTVTPSYGSYLVETAGCGRCHGQSLSGGDVRDVSTGAVPAPSLAPAALASWTQADFVTAMRTGRRRDGSVLDARMPWRYYAQLSDLELDAVWAALTLRP